MARRKRRHIARRKEEIASLEKEIASLADSLISLSSAKQRRGEAEAGNREKEKERTAVAHEKESGELEILETRLAGMHEEAIDGIRDDIARLEVDIKTVGRSLIEQSIETIWPVSSRLASIEAKKRRRDQPLITAMPRATPARGIASVCVL